MCRITEQQIELIYAAVQSLVAGVKLKRFTDPEYFPTLVGDVRRRYVMADAAKASPDTELYAVAALSVLAPFGHGVPPRRLCKELISIVEENTDQNVDRMFEFAVAFGCGKWRETEQKDTGWSGVWERAVEVMSLSMVHAVRDVNLWLGSHVPGYPEPWYWRSDEGGIMIEMDARYLALYLIHPVRSLHIRHDEGIYIHSEQDGVVYESPGDEEKYPAGARLSFSCITAVEMIKQLESAAREPRNLEAGTFINIMAGDAETSIKFIPKIHGMKLKAGEQAFITGDAHLEQLACACGNRNCQQKHRLSGWDPDGGTTLWSFLASAVKGQAGLFTKSIAAGLYYPMLAFDGCAAGVRVRLVPVMVKECHNPGCGKPDKPGRYEGSKCSCCGEAFNQLADRRIKQDMLVAASDEEHYELQLMQHCGGVIEEQGRTIECDNFYSPDAPCCPLCGWSPARKRPTKVWVRNAAGQRLNYYEPEVVEWFEAGSDDGPAEYLEAEETINERIHSGEYDIEEILDSDAKEQDEGHDNG